MTFRASLLVFLLLGWLTACGSEIQTIDPVPGRAIYVPFPVRINLDGNLDDWAGIERVTVTEGKHFGSSPGNNDQFSFALAADTGNFYVMMTTPDQEVVSGRSGEAFWQEDSFEFFLNFTGNLAADTYDDGIMQVIVNATAVDAGASTNSISGQNVPPGTQAVTFTTEDGWGFEARVPLHGQHALKHGKAVGFQAYGNGGSLWGRNAHLIWAASDPDGDAWDNPAVFGQALLTEMGRDDIPQPVVVSQSGMEPGTWGEIVTQTWRHYREQYIFCGENCGGNLGLVFDPSVDYIAVSEGIGYGMLIAVMLDDQETFDYIYDAATRILLDPNNNLHHWRATSNGVVTDAYSATDAEQDIALALIFASERVQLGEWQPHDSLPYDEHAQQILDAVFIEQVIEDRYLTPGTLRGFDGINLMNPSYFSPAWYRIYDDFEEGNRWDALIEEGYATLERNPGAAYGLAPDWMSVDGSNAADHCQTMNINLNNCRFQMRYDAIRVPWRVGVDCLWFDEPRACSWSRRSVEFLKGYDNVNTLLLYDLDGAPIVDYRDEVMLSMWYFAALGADDPFFAAEIENRLQGFGDPATNGYWGEDPDLYYNQSLALFAATWLSEDFENLYRAGRPLARAR